MIDMDEGTKACIFLLHYKLVKFSSGTYQDLGLMTIDEISDEILRNRFPLEDVAAAVQNSVKSGQMRMHYLKDCQHCATPNIVGETDGEDLSDYSSVLRKTGKTCEYCHHKITYDEPFEKLAKLYSVTGDSRSSEELLVDLEKVVDPDQLNLNDESYLQRIKRWLTPKPSGNLKKA